MRYASFLKCSFSVIADIVRSSPDRHFHLPIHSGIVRKADDCGMKEWITIKVSGGYQPSAGVNC